MDKMISAEQAKKPAEKPTVVDQVLTLVNQEIKHRRGESDWVCVCPRFAVSPGNRNEVVDTLTDLGYEAEWLHADRDTLCSLYVYWQD